MSKSSKAARGRPRQRQAAGRGTESPVELFRRLVEIMQVLRSPDGCPWDREQTLESLRPFLLEETYEVLEAIERRDAAALAGEIGDLIFEGVFLSQIAAEAGAFTIADALRSIIDKLVRRHPHVFGKAATGDRDPRGEPRRPRTSREVLERWEQLKADEPAAAGAPPRTLLGGVPRTLPALLRAYEIGDRVASVGFDWLRARDVLPKIDEEVVELRRALDTEEPARAEEELGDVLFAIANLARKLGIEPEAALRRANDKFTRRFDNLESRVRAQGRRLHDLTLEELEEQWALTKP